MQEAILEKNQGKKRKEKKRKERKGKERKRKEKKRKEKKRKEKKRKVTSSRTKALAWDGFLNLPSIPTAPEARSRRSHWKTGQRTEKLEKSCWHDILWFYVSNHMPLTWRNTCFSFISKPLQDAWSCFSLSSYSQGSGFFSGKLK